MRIFFGLTFGKLSSNVFPFIRIDAFKNIFKFIQNSIRVSYPVNCILFFSMKCGKITNK